MRFHIASLPHTQVNDKFSPCAYTQKLVKLGKMLMSLGHEVILYAAEHSDASVCTEMVQIISEQEQAGFFGGTDWTKQFFPLQWEPELPYWKLTNMRTIDEMRKRIQPRDFILTIAGRCHMEIGQAFPNNDTVEPGIGYYGVFSNYRVFESYFWMSHVYGLIKQDNGSWYDAVIPNYFDENQFEIRPKKDYYLYFGRLIPRKGLQIVSDIAERLKIKVICVGQGKLNDPYAGVNNCNITSKYLEHVGSADIEQRKILMAEAKACFVPTFYLEPFGGVAVEAMMSGTPVITTDWGAFPETVQHGKTGYRCRTLDQFVWATKNADKLKPEDCRNWAVDNYGLEKVKNMYQEYFEMVANIRSGKGWYQENDSRRELDWLKRSY